MTARRAAAATRDSQRLSRRVGGAYGGAFHPCGAPGYAAQRLVLENFPDTVLARQLSPNGRVHWAVKKDARKTAAERIAGGCIVAGIRPVDGPVTITLRWVFPTAGRHDLDNLVATSKGFLDSLVRRGILPDDSSEHVVDIRAEVVIERKRRALEIIIEPVEHAGRPAGEVSDAD